MLMIIPSCLTALLITFFAIPSIIKIAHEKNLCDEPGERRSHSSSIPTLGGLGIFAGLIFSVTYWIPFNIEDVGGGQSHRYIQYLLCAFIIIFLIGAKDDIIPLTPRKKFAGQIAAAGILVYMAEIRLTSFYGVFGVYDIPFIVSIIISMFTIVLIINALNLIDGINGLAGTVGCIFCAAFGFYFYKIGRIDLAVLAASLGGALAAFLHYNFRSKIFMGDTGSLLTGLTAAILAIKFIEENRVPNSEWAIDSVPAVAIAVLIIPLFDTLRVFTMRVLKGKSPFSPDRTHIHHLLLDAGCSHIQATSILGIVNICFIIFAYNLQHIGTLLLIAIMFAIGLLLVLMTERIVGNKIKVNA